MKKFFLAILAVGAVATAQAQKAGSLFLYGDAGYSASKQTDDDGLPGTADNITKYRNWNFSPGLGFQFNKYFGAGINFSIGMRTNTNDNGSITSENKMTELMVGPFIRHTMPLGKIFFVYSQLNLSYLHGKNTYDDGIAGTPDVESSYNGFYVGWFPAIGANVTSGMAFTMSYGGLNYQKKNYDLTGPAETTTSDFNFTFGKTVNMGIQLNFGGHHHHGRGHHMEPGMEHRHMDMSDDEDEDDAPKSKKSSDIEE